MNLAALILLFLVLGVGFIFVHLVAGKLIRPSKPGAEKGTIYECGEPTIGSAWVQFDLRFYVVALLFVIFDVEVAFFFPWAEVFGKANAVTAASRGSPADWTDRQLKDYGDKVASLIPPVESNPAHSRILNVYRDPQALKEALAEADDKDYKANAEAASGLAVLALGEIVVFFGVLLVGFAYLWNRGDLEWVRSLAERASRPQSVAPVAPAARVLHPVKPPEPAVAAGHAH